MAPTTASLDRLRQLLRPTTFIRSSALNRELGLDLLIASETFQHTGSFKFRAAFNMAQSVSQQRLIAASSGNFGQALAYACQLLGKSCTIVMPANSARVKVEAVRRYGGTVDLVDVASKTRGQRVKEVAEEQPDAIVVSAFDHPAVIEGNSTLGEELALVQDQFDAVIVPVGGGGLLSGVIEGMRRAGSSKPVFGAEPLIANDAARSLKEGQILKNETEPQTIADGVRTLALGQHNWRIIEHGCAGILEVPEETIKDALGKLFFLANLKVEPTGALSMAAALVAGQQGQEWRGKRLCCVASGGNVDLSVFLSLLQTEPG